MPTYEYECKNCGHTFEAFQSMNDAPLESCPECGRNVRRLIHGGTGVIFKGSGFYVTDKGKKSSGAAPKNSMPAETASGNTPKGGVSSGSEQGTTSGGNSDSKKSEPAARSA